MHFKLIQIGHFVVTVVKIIKIILMINIIEPKELEFCFKIYPEARVRERDNFERRCSFRL
jgi:hypothetical protein